MTDSACVISGSTVLAVVGIFDGASATLALKDSVVCGNIVPLGADLDNLGSVTLDDSTVGVSVGIP
jgi:hypothetical protein